MPPGSLHPCNGAACRALVPHGQRWCETCAKAKGAEDRERRGSARERGYDSRWERYRRTYLEAHPLCVECASGVPLPGGVTPRAVTPATVVDHIKAHKGDHRLFWAPANHRAVCKPHHDARTDEGDFGRPAGTPRVAGPGNAHPCVVPGSGRTEKS